MKNIINTAEEAIQDIINRYDFQQDNDFCTQDKQGRWIRKCMVLINKQEPTKRRFVQWFLSDDGQDAWRVFLPSPRPPKEAQAVQRKASVYVEATLKVLQEQFFQNRCRVPPGTTCYGHCIRCGGDLVYEMDQSSIRFVCFGKQRGYCDFAENWRCH